MCVEGGAKFVKFTINLENLTESSVSYASVDAI